MNNRIIKISLADIALDYREASDVVNKACSRFPGMKAVGLCESDDKVMVSLEKFADYENYEYVFAPFPSENEDGIIGEINNRYYSGFSTIGDFWVNEQKWGFFMFDKKAMENKSKK